MTRKVGQPVHREARKRWWILVVVSLGGLMTLIDGTIVNVALPSIATSLGFSRASLVWVVNAYLLSFGGSLLLGGRLGDLLGQRRIILLGTALFTVASLICGLAGNQAVLIAGRIVQGVGAAFVSAVSLSLIMTSFSESSERAKAMGVFGFVNAVGGSLGLLLGGTLTSALDWRWIFLVNLPVGIAVYAGGSALLGEDSGRRPFERLDFAGALTVTTCLMLADYAIVDGGAAGWTSQQTVARIAGVAALLAVFIRVETRVSAPLVPLALFQVRSLTLGSLAAVLWAVAMFTWFFTTVLYLQLVLGYTPFQVSLAFLPSNLIIAAFSLGVSARLIGRFGIRPPLTLGLLILAVGLTLLARAQSNGSMLLDVLPGMLLVGMGAGMAFNPLLIAAMSGVTAGESGVASGVINTALALGGSLGLASVAAIAAARSNAMLSSGADLSAALNSGYHVSFLVVAVCAAAAAAVCGWMLSPSRSRAQSRIQRSSLDPSQPPSQPVPDDGPVN